MKGLLRTAALVCIAIAAAGCAPPYPETMVSRRQLVAEYNTNAAAVPRLWARAKMDVTVPTEDGVAITFHPDGVILLGKDPKGGDPADFVLRGTQSGLEVFRVGLSAAEGIYYFWYLAGDRGKAFWGRQGLSGAATVQLLPIDPNDLLAVLSICQLPDDFTTIPTVALSMQDEPGEFAYVLTYLDRQVDTGLLVFRREIYFRWDDAKPRRPFLVKFFNAEGRRVLTGKLKKYKPIETGRAGASSPVMPTDIEINWPARKSRIRIRLSEMTTVERGDPAAAARFDPPVAPHDVIQVDRHLEHGGGQR
ncbi:MAG: hypothetical protein KAX78_09835 [Phycisphaerae bacterium]|nr:hypothetical protein [Phycisphaerae bacterium]